MSTRIYKSEGVYKDNETVAVIDDRHEIFNIYGSQCSKCKHFEEWDYFCPAYQNGIPDELLSGVQKHNKIRIDQDGSTIFEPK